MPAGCKVPFADRLAAALAAAVPPGRLARNVPMSLHTSFRIGGPAEFFVTVADRAELLAVIEICRDLGAPHLVLGRGTNLLVRDGGIRGVVVSLAGEFRATHFDGRDVTAGAAVGLADLAGECGRRGLAGLEFAIGIPGSVGGAVVMNAGAYGSEMKDAVAWAEVIRPALPGDAGARNGAGAEDDPARGSPLRVARLPAADLGFGYRTSRPQREGWLVTAAGFSLAEGNKAAIHAREEDYTTRRRAKQPLDRPSAGSVFKRPEGHYAGALIDRGGCRGLRVGDAQVSELHAGFIVNLGSATASDVLELIAKVREKVLAETGVLLEPEIKVVGEDSR